MINDQQWILSDSYDEYEFLRLSEIVIVKGFVSTFSGSNQRGRLVLILEGSQHLNRFDSHKIS